MNGLKEKQSEVFDESEFCDRCIARAVSVITKDEMILFFCNHHKNKYSTKLTELGWSVNIL